MVPEIWSATDKIFCHFGPFHFVMKNWKKTIGDIIVLQMCTMNDNHMMYGSWEKELDVHNLLSFWTISGPFTSLTTRKIKMCTKTHDHMLYCSWYGAWGIKVFFFIFGYFLPFYPLGASKIKHFWSMKKSLEILSCYTCAPKIMMTRCTIPEIRCITDGRMDR